MAPNVALGGTLKGYYDFGESKEEALQLAVTIRCHWEIGSLTDFIVNRFGLPMPDRQICILWNWYEWVEMFKHTSIPNKDDTIYEIYCALFDSSFRFGPLLGQGPLFEWPLSYLSAFFQNFRAQLRKSSI